MNSLHLIPQENFYSIWKKVCKNCLKREIVYMEKGWPSNGQTICLFLYMRVNRINGNIWPPEKWSFFNQHVRTNNDAEGWQHSRINERERAKLNFYELVPKLFAEARLIPLQNKLFCKKIFWNAAERLRLALMQTYFNGGSPTPKQFLAKSY
jgi:hypothetical protein